MMPFDPVMADEYRHNSGKEDAEWAAKCEAERPGAKADLLKEWAFVSEKVCDNAAGSVFAEAIIGALASGDDAALGAAIREAVSAAADAALDDVEAGNVHQDFDALIKWWQG